MKNYLVYVQYQAKTCKHRHSIKVYIRARNEQDALNYASSIPCNPDYELRRVNILEEFIIHDVDYTSVV